MKRNTYKKRIKRQVLLTLFAGMTAFSGAITGDMAPPVSSPIMNCPREGKVCGKTIRALTRMWAVRASLS